MTGSRAASIQGTLDAASPVSKHRQLKGILQRHAVSVCRPGQAIPSERDLTRHFGVARMTVRHAIDSLVEDGVLERIIGVGTFVARPKMDLQVKLTSYSEEMHRRGMVPAARVLRFDEVPAVGALAREMELPEGTPVVRFRRLLLADGQPMSVDENYLPSHKVPGFLDEPAPTSLYSSLNERYGLVMEWGEDQVEATAATHENAQQLAVDVGSPLLKIQRHAYVRRELVDYSVSLYRADRYKLWVPLQRPGSRAPHSYDTRRD
ncbi:GntR family transcriptional regulator [Arthrobacter halodurans]|uniref:GntR family transcriptional regulator n=1 Tax=Arthrobacter halodurans TaxID=516699 RepID=A0ABV4ULQ3_9MICC